MCASNVGNFIFKGSLVMMMIVITFKTSLVS